MCPLEIEIILDYKHVDPQRGVPIHTLPIHHEEAYIAHEELKQYQVATDILHCL
jgi:hypothetical protein